ncbi:MAG: hypothetical protein AAF548_17465 [Actinomycetota bacterium]
MAITVDVVEFTSIDPSPLVREMDAMAASGDGDGWINFGPALSPEEFAAVPHKTGLGKWFSGRGPAVPMATWTPGVVDGKPRAAQIGLQHGTGPSALDRLEETGLSLPATWIKKQDHAKHGIVAEVPVDGDGEQLVRWLLRAMAELSPLIPTGSQWLAEVNRPE